MNQVQAPETISPKPPADRLFSFDLIRAIAMLLIVLVHFNIEIFTRYPGSHLVGSIDIFKQYMGDLGVTLFIILSGSALMLAPDDKYSTPAFFKKRALTVYPSFWVCYAAFALAFGVMGHWPNNSNYLKLPLSFIGLDGFFLYRMSSFYLVGEWFTGFILIVYLFFPALRYGLLNFPKRTWFVLLAMAGVLLSVYGHIFTIPQRCNPLLRLPDFYFGMFFVRNIMNSPKFKYLFIITLSLTILFWFWQPPIGEQPFLFVSGMVIFSTMAYLTRMINPTDTVRRIVSFVAKHSFVVFLLHHQIVYFFSPRIDATKLSYPEVYLYFLCIMLLSFLGSVALEPVINRLTAFMKSRLFPQKTDNP